MDKLYTISCDPECSFMVRSHEKKESIDIAKKHVLSVHKMKLTDKDLEEKMKISS